MRCATHLDRASVGGFPWCAQDRRTVGGIPGRGGRCSAAEGASRKPGSRAGGSEAVLRVRGPPFDLFLMGLQMPVPDGFRAMEAIRPFEGSVGRSAVPNPACSSTTPSPRASASDAGANLWAPPRCCGRRWRGRTSRQVPPIKIVRPQAGLPACEASANTGRPTGRCACRPGAPNQGEIDVLAPRATALWVPPPLDRVSQCRNHRLIEGLP